MPTTLTIDDDLARLLTRRARELGLPFKDLVNRMLRAGLGAEAAPKTIPHAFGFKAGIDLDKLNHLAGELEAQAYERNQRCRFKSRQRTPDDR